MKHVAPLSAPRPASLAFGITEAFLIETGVQIAFIGSIVGTILKGLTGNLE